MLRLMTAPERQELIDLCDAKIHSYIEKRGDAPWSHRKKSSGYVPGSVRYDVLARAKGRCEACGVTVQEMAIEVDHIVPRNKGGTDDPSNLQALCYRCNAQKRDRDATDFGAANLFFPSVITYLQRIRPPLVPRTGGASRIYATNFCIMF